MAEPRRRRGLRRIFEWVRDNPIIDDIVGIQVNDIIRNVMSWRRRPAADSGDNARQGRRGITPADVHEIISSVKDDGKRAYARGLYDLLNAEEKAKLHAISQRHAARIFNLPTTEQQGAVAALPDPEKSPQEKVCEFWNERMRGKVQWPESWNRWAERQRAEREAERVRREAVQAAIAAATPSGVPYLSGADRFALWVGRNLTAMLCVALVILGATVVSCVLFWDSLGKIWSAIAQ